MEERREGAASPPMMIKVEVISERVVTPATAAGKGRHMFLPANDIYWRWLPYMRRVLFYDSTGPAPTTTTTTTDDDDDDGGDTSPDPARTCQSRSIRTLTHSLARVLVDFYPFAGRLAVNDEDDGRIHLLCNDAGVEWTEASVEGLRFQDLQREGFQFHDFFSDFIPRHAVDPDTGGVGEPLLKIQVTRFVGGELALGVASSHVVGDGTAFWNFMVSWAEHAAQIDIEDLNNVRLSIPPVLDRKLLDFRGLLPMLLRECNNDPNKVLERCLDTCWQPPHDCDQMIPKPKPKPSSLRVFNFSRETLSTLKAQANEGTRPPNIGGDEVGNAVKYTTYKVLAAHAWRTIIASMRDDDNVAADDHVRVGLVIAVDVRGRLQPALPRGYFGNAIIAKTVIATFGELRKEPLAATVCRIHDAIASITATSIMQEMASRELLRKEHLAHWGSSFFVLSSGGSHRFPVFHVDFGWGPPLCVRHMLHLGRDINFCFFPDRSENGIEVTLTLPSNLHHMSNPDLVFQF